MSDRFVVSGCFRGGGTLRAWIGSVIYCRGRAARVLTSSSSVGILRCGSRGGELKSGGVQKVSKAWLRAQISERENLGWESTRRSIVLHFDCQFSSRKCPMCEVRQSKYGYRGSSWTRIRCIDDR